MAKFKEGDTIRVVRNLHFVKAEFDKNYLGKDFEISYVFPENAYSHGQSYGVANRPCVVYEDEIELVPGKHELHITCVDGKTTNAVYKVNGKIVKRAKAERNPADEFKFKTGAMIAAARTFDVTVIDTGSLNYDNINETEYTIDKIVNDRNEEICMLVIPDEETEVKPHLEYNDENKEFLGNIGENAGFTDIHGNPLFVGDVVDVYYYTPRLLPSLISCGEFPVRHDKDGYFIMGIKDNVTKHTKVNKDRRMEIDERKYFSFKKKSFQDIPNGTVIAGVRYII